MVKVNNSLACAFESLREMVLMVIFDVGFDVMCCLVRKGSRISIQLTATSGAKTAR